MSRGLILGVVVVLLACVSGVQAVDIVTVTVGNPYNAGELSGEGAGGYGPDRICGAVDYVYNIGTFEVTAGQYTEFLNAVAATDTYELWNPYMWDDYPYGDYGCRIERHGNFGSYTYSVAGDWAARPVNYVSWGDAARFANWLHNGQPMGAQDLTTTEDGSYYLNGATSVAELMAAVREEDATWVIPSEDEWYKAAYHKNDGGTGNYFDYATSSDIIPSNVLEDPDPGNNANFWDWDQGGYTIGDPYYRTEVGEFENSESPYGSFDQDGNVWEWNQALLSSSYRGVRGGSIGDFYWALHAAYRSFDNPTREDYPVGFRVADLRCHHDADCDDDVACTEDSCNEATDSCDNIPNDALCDNELYCDGVETCNTVSGCQAGTAVDCDDGVSCTDDSCNERTDSCDNIPNNVVCDNDLYCDGTETCNPLLGCQPGTAVDCDDSVDCTIDSCNEESDSCDNDPNDDACDDETFCNGEEVCDSVNGCQPGTAPDCDDSIPCTFDYCDGVTDSCAHEPFDELCDDDNPCTDDSCEPGTGCVYVNNAEPCDDENECTLDDECVDGECEGTYQVRIYADIYPVPDGDGAVEGFDILCVLDAANELNTYGCMTVMPSGYKAGDIYPCDSPDGAVEGFDILAVLDAANDISWCPDPCPPLP